MATKKKTARKKAADKSIAENSKTLEYPPLPPLANGLDRLAGLATAATMQNIIGKKLERRKGREVRMLSFSDSRVETYPSLSFFMDWLLNSRGLPQSIYNVIGRDGSGKSSFFFNLMGHLAVAGFKPFYYACEKKDIDEQWAMRCFHTDPALAATISRIASITPDLRSLDDLFENMVMTLKECRDAKSPLYASPDIPFAVFLDPLNKLPTAAQVAGIVAYDGQDKEDMVDLAEKGHSWDRAKWYHDMTQRLTAIQPEFNARFFIGEHQNQGNVAGGGPRGNAFTPEHTKEGANRTRPGGEAINQTAGIQFTLVERGFVYSAGEKIARRIQISALKSSHGPSKNVRVANFAIKQENFKDRPDFLDPCIRWDYTTLEWCVEHGYFGAAVTGKTIAQFRYNVEELGLRGLSLEEAAEALMAPEHRPMFERLGHDLKIPGYYSPAKVVQEGTAPEAPVT